MSIRQVNGSYRRRRSDMGGQHKVPHQRTVWKGLFRYGVPFTPFKGAQAGPVNGALARLG